MNQRQYERTEANIPVDVTVRGSTYSDCHIINYSDGGLFIELQESFRNKISSADTLDSLEGEEVIVTIPIKPNLDTPNFASLFTVSRIAGTGFGVTYMH